jgi:hypothetical protein
MPDPSISDEDVVGLTRAYLSRRRAQPAPRDLEANAMSFAFTRGRTKQLAVILGSVALVVASALTAGVVLAFHHTETYRGVTGTGSATQSRVHITRIAGNLTLPPINRTIRDTKTVAALALDIHALPRFPLDERCPADSGTYYSLMFAVAGSAPWTATIGAQGCEVVRITGQPAQWAAHSPQLWSDLAMALGLSPDQIQPSSVPTGTVVGGIERCAALPFTPAPAEPFLAGTVDVFRGNHWSQNQPVFEQETVSAGGQYKFNLPPGEYVLAALDPASYFTSPMVTVTVAIGTTTTQNIPPPESCK